MRHFLTVGMLCMLPLCLFAQKDGCKFTKVKTGSKTLSTVKVPGKIGNLYIGKDESRYFVLYEPKGVYTLIEDSDNMIKLRIDSVEFAFEGYTNFPVKVAGSGRMKNTNDRLRYFFQTVNFSFYIEDMRLLEAFKSGKITALKVSGEKNAEWGDYYTEEQQQQLKAAFACLP